MAYQMVLKGDDGSGGKTIRVEVPVKLWLGVNEENEPVRREVFELDFHCSTGTPVHT